MNINDTPRTDAEAWTSETSDTCGDVVWSDFSRTLERELNAANREIAILRKVGIALADSVLAAVEPIKNEKPSPVTTS